LCILFDISISSIGIPFFSVADTISVAELMLCDNVTPSEWY
jgi:hypothetical protein